VTDLWHPDWHYKYLLIIGHTLNNQTLGLFWTSFYPSFCVLALVYLWYWFFFITSGSSLKSFLNTSKIPHWFDNIIYSDNDYILFISFLIVSLIFNNIPVWIYHLNVTLSFLLEFVLSWSFDMLVHVDFILTFIGFPISKLWAYLIKTIPETRRVPQIRYLRFYDYHWVNTSDGGLLVPDCIIRPVVSVSALTWFIRYNYYWN
jgi:hypothetical protein